MKKIKITFGKVRKPTPEELQRTIDADLIRTTERMNERLEIVWGWKHDGIFNLATMREVKRLDAASEKAEHDTYRCEIIERTYQQYKRKQRNLAADDWREIIGAINNAELDPSGHEATPDWDWFMNVLALSQGQCEESINAEVKIRCEIKERIAGEMDDKAETRAMIEEMRGGMKEVKRNLARLAGERETKREHKSAAAKKAAAANRDKVHDDELAAALAKVHENAGDDKAKIAFWCRKVIANDNLQVRGRGGVYKPMPPETLARYYRTYRKTHGGT